MVRLFEVDQGVPKRPAQMFGSRLQKETFVMRLSKLTALFAILAVPMAVTIASDAAQAQVRDCVIVGNILPIGQNSVGAIQLTSGETCNMFLTTSGTVVSSNISERPKNGTLTLEGAGSMRYKPRDGYTGTDEFAVTVTGHTQAGTADVTSILKVIATVK